MKSNRLPILILLLLCLTLAGCTSKTTTITNSAIEHISQVNFEELIKYKGSYVGDNSAVGSIINLLPGNIYNQGFSLQTSESPYSITIDYNLNPTLSEVYYYQFWTTDRTEDLLEDNASVLFSLIQNVDQIHFNVYDITSIIYTRTERQTDYGQDLSHITQDTTTWQDFID